MKIETRGEQHVFEVQVSLNGLDSKAVRVELHADGANGSGPTRQEMTLVWPLAGAPGCDVFTATVSATRPATDYTVRMIPHHEGVAVPLEAAHIL